MHESMSTWFAYPALLWCLAALPALAILLFFVQARRRRMLNLLGHPAAIEKLRLDRPRLRAAQTLALFLGLGTLIIGIAGPRWGRMLGSGGAYRNETWSSFSMLAVACSPSSPAGKISPGERSVTWRRP